MHAKSKISEMLPKSFKAQKCKTLLKLAVSRMKLLKNKREALVKQMRRDLAQLLETGQDQTARIRVEHVIKEEKTMTAYDLIEIYCEMIDSRLPIIESQKNCPIDLKEAIASVIFASPRCADIPELMDIRKQLAAKYGKEFVKAALEVRPDCGVSNMMIEKLSVKAPNIQTKIKVLNEVAKEHTIKWEPKAFEEQIEKPKDDLLSGPSSFISSEKMTIKSSDVKSSFVNSWNNQATPSFSQDNTPSQAQDARSTRVAEESISMSRSSWKMEFKDATSAAEAAAESAERASMAARAAADLASRGNISRQAPGATHNSSAYAINGEGPESVKSSYVECNFNSRGSVAVEDNERRGSHNMKQNIHNLPKDELVWSSGLNADENINSSYPKNNRNSGGSVSVADNEREGSEFVKPKMQNLQKDELVRKSTLSVDEPLSRYLSSREKFSERPEFNSSSMDRMGVGLNLGKENDMSSDYAQKSFTGLEPTSKNVKNDNSGNYDQRHETVPSVYASAFNDYRKDEHENKNEDDSFGVCYDNYDTDKEDHSFTGRHREENLFDAFLPQPREEPSSFSLKIDSWSYKQRTTGSPSNLTSSLLQPSEESHQTDNTEMTRKEDPKSDSDDPQPPKYDSPKYDSEEPSSESEESEESTFQHTDSRSRKGSVPTQINHMDDTVEADEGNESSSSASFPGVKNLEVEPSSNEKNWRSGITMRNSQHAQRSCGSQVNDTWSESTEEQANTVTSDEGSTGVLNFGALTGGLRQRGYYRPTYQRNTGVAAPYRPKTDSDDISLTEEKEISISELSTSIDAANEEKLSKDSPTNTFRYKSRTPRANVDAVESRSEGLFTSSNRKPRASVDSEGIIVDIAVEGRESRYEGLFTSSNRSPDDTSVTRRPFSSQYRKNSEDQENTVHESYLERGQSKEYKESIPRSTVRLTGDNVSTPKSQKLDDSTSLEESTVYHLTRTHKNSEVPDERFYRQKPQTRAHNDSSSRMPISYSHLDDTGAEEKDPQTTSVREGNNLVKLSRRTRPTPSVAKEEKVPRESDQSDMGPVKGPKASVANPATEPSSGRKGYSRNLDDVEPSKPKQSYSLAEASSPKHLQTKLSIGRSPKSSQDESIQPSVKENDEKPTVSSSKEKTVSRENSSKSSSHVHPKMPDYDSLTAHFHSLRANVRRK